MYNCKISLFINLQFYLLQFKIQKSQQENLNTVSKNFNQPIRFANKYGVFELNLIFFLIVLEYFKLLETAFYYIWFQMQV